MAVLSPEEFDPRGGKPALKDVDWPTYRSTWKDYVAGRLGLVISEQDLEGFIWAQRSLVVLDLMSSTTAIESIFNEVPGGPKFGLSVSLEDRRTYEEIRMDMKLNIHHLVRDISMPQTLVDIRQELEGRRPNLVLERAEGGLPEVPATCEYYSGMLAFCYELLSPESGMMLFQIPDDKEFHDFIKPLQYWTSVLRRNHTPAFYNPNFGSMQGGALKVIKTPDSPPTLPAIS